MISEIVHQSLIHTRIDSSRCPDILLIKNIFNTFTFAPVLFANLELDSARVLSTSFDNQTSYLLVRVRGVDREVDPLLLPHLPDSAPAIALATVTVRRRCYRRTDCIYFACF